MLFGQRPDNSEGRAAAAAAVHAIETLRPATSVLYRAGRIGPDPGVLSMTVPEVR
jgi:hypothetical protein